MAGPCLPGDCEFFVVPLRLRVVLLALLVGSVLLYLAGRRLEVGGRRAREGRWRDVAFFGGRIEHDPTAELLVIERAQLLWSGHVLTAHVREAVGGEASGLLQGGSVRLCGCRLLAQEAELPSRRLKCGKVETPAAHQLLP